MTIADIDRHLTAAEQALKLRSHNAAKAFPGVIGDGKLAKLSMPTAVLQTLLRWLWLSWHAEANYKKVRATAHLVIERSVEAIKIAPDDEMRPQHDAFALLASIMSGEVGLIREIAHLSVSANPSSRGKQFYEAWAGILKARVLDNRHDELNQLAVFKKNKGLGLFAEPSNILAEAFCRKEYAILNREVVKSVERNQQEAEELGAISYSGSEEGKFFLSQGNTVFRFRWPWPEAVFAKLAIFDGASFDFDPFWLPKGFLVDWWEPSTAE